MTKRSANLHKTRFKDGAAVEAIFVSLWPHASSYCHVTNRSNVELDISYRLV